MLVLFTGEFDNVVAVELSTVMAEYYAVVDVIFEEVTHI